MKSRGMEAIMKSGRTSLSEADKLAMMNTHGWLELEAAAALLMLRYQYDISAVPVTGCPVAQTTPPPAPAVVEPEKCTPKEQVRGEPKNPSTQPLKKRSIPPHLLRRSLTPAKSTPNQVNNSSCGGGAVSGVSSSSGIVKAKLKVAQTTAACNKALLKSCRNMIREFLDNQELI